ncbi:hypothetical protein EDD86DRAFT_74 [Gorgonomyces haynaldii]|nr:hypothetical protein EDD86DRAFT_74 [Gorgonomyces haynaldii]
MQDLLLAVKASLDGGQLVKQFFNNPVNIQTKQSLADLVTETDQKVQQLIQSTLLSNSDYKFIGEEAPYDPLSDDPTWIVDPIDGTTNFVHGFPYVAISIGLSVGRKPTVGVVYLPILNHLYYALDGHGAYLVENPTDFKFGDGKRLEHTKPLPNDFQSVLIATEYGSGKNEWELQPKIDLISKLIQPPVQSRGIRSVGAAAPSMCLVASGAVDFYYEAGFHCWDICAGIVIVRESGGYCSNWKSDDTDIMLRNLVCCRGPTNGKPEIIKQFHEMCPVIPYDRD